MKKYVFLIGLMCCLAVPKIGHSQLAIAEIIKKAVIKVIKAVDLKVQRLQNKTIWLQNAQKYLENEMSKLKLNEISGWVEKQRKLYDDYFQELGKVKVAISTYSKVKGILERQVQMVREYQAAWARFQQDKLITPGELEVMGNIYAGMLEQSSRNLDGLLLIVNAFETTMSDGKRLQFIDEVAERAEEGLMDLKKFNEQTKMISIQRAAERGEIEYVKKLYGL